MKKIVLFDFDGVILDSFEAAFEATRALDPETTAQEFRDRFNGNINNWKNNLLQKGVENPDEEFFKAYLPLFEKSRIFPGIREVITKLKEKYILLIISSTISSPIRDFIKQHDMEECFDGVMGNDVHNSKTEKIKMVHDKYGAAADDCIFITDTLGDIKEARKAGVRSIGVAWGFQDKENLLKGNPLAVVKTPEELLTIIEERLG